jgi:ribonuclease D
LEKIDIKLVDTDVALEVLATSLSQKAMFAFDTEFDRFWREYGFKLFLLQIYDGETCYLVDPLAITNLMPLWVVFENPAICKVAYACIEDIQILKINGCNPVNIFDIQIAAKLCNHPSNSFADLVGDKFNVVIDKSFQRSNWRNRPLQKAQQVYASNDVIWLLQLKNDFYKTVTETGLYKILEEENRICETTVVTEYTVKLSSKQMATFSPYHQSALLNLFHIRNDIAAAYNMPPANIVNDSVLEIIVENKQQFYKHGFAIGFCKNLLEDELNQLKFKHAIDEIDESIPNIPVKRERQGNYESFADREKRKMDAEQKCTTLHTFFEKQYGIVAGAFLLRGLKKSLQIRPYAEVELRNYQHKLINDACVDLNIKL